MSISGLVPARFLTIVAHLIITIILFWAKEDNIKACLPVGYSEDDYKSKDTELIIALSVSLGLFALELVGFLAGVTMFTPTQAMISIAAHASATVTLAYYMFDTWECDLYWWVFGFCCCLPAVTEIMTLVGVLAFKKGP